MREARLDDFSALLLKLYRTSAETALETCQDAALEVIKPLLPFDTCMWGMATYLDGQGIDIHSIHLHNEPQAMIEEYEPVKHLDTAASAMAGLPQLTTRGFHNPSYFAGPERSELRDYLHRFGHENSFITAYTDQRTGATQWLTLFRADVEQHCRPEEVRLLHQLAPHLMQGLHHNRAMHLGTWNAHAAAVADARGLLCHATPGWEDMLRAEWGAALRPGRLPAPLLDWLRATDAPFIGRTLAARRQVRKDLLFVRLRPLCPADGLAPRQREVAALMAQGLTHKQAAQRLGLSPATVRNQIQAVYDRLGVGNVAGLVEALRQAD